jgi:anthraniloyl-CoA monooxygenase
VREAFVRAAALADAAGFDLLELRFARGGLLAACLSPRPDRRRDGDGDALAERLRLPLEVFDAVRAAWPASKPMSVRIAARDAPDGGEPATGTERDAIAAGTDGGVTAEEAVEIARALKAHGCDIVAVSSTPSDTELPAAGRRLTHAPVSDRVRHEAGIPTMTVGHIASYADVNSLLAAGRADLCVLARAHLYDPYWTRHAAHAQGVDLPWPEPYAAVRTFQPRGGFQP